MNEILYLLMHIFIQYKKCGAINDFSYPHDPLAVM